MSSVIVDQRAEATRYINDKKVNKLFDILGAQLARQKPEDPNEFLLNELRRISDLKESNQPVGLSSLRSFCFALILIRFMLQVSLFAERDIEIMFSIFDLTNRGYIDRTQYLKGLTSVCHNC